MNETDWAKDPELKALRAEFVASLNGRLAELRTLMKELETTFQRNSARNSQEMNQEILIKLRFLTHKLAGAAESYGFPTLTLLSDPIDAALEASSKPWPGPAWVITGCKVLEGALNRALQGTDPSELSRDPWINGWLKANEIKSA